MSVYQLFVGLASVWTIRIPAISDLPVPWSDFFAYLGKAHRCFLGHAVELNGAVEPCDTDVLTTFLVFIAFNISYVLLIVSSAVALPLTDLLYMVPVLTGGWSEVPDLRRLCALRARHQTAGVPLGCGARLS